MAQPFGFFRCVRCAFVMVPRFTRQKEMFLERSGPLRDKACMLSFNGRYSMSSRCGALKEVFLDQQTRRGRVIAPGENRHERRVRATIRAWVMEQPTNSTEFSPRIGMTTSSKCWLVGAVVAGLLRWHGTIGDGPFRAPYALKGS